MLIDLHNHTSRFSSCSLLDPETLVDQAIEAGLDGLAFTEHDIWFNDKMKEQLQKRAGDRLTLFTGIEHTIPGFHVLSFGDQIPTGHKDSLEELEEDASRYDCALILAHPWRWGAIDHFTNDTDLSEFLKRFDAVEIASANLLPEEQLAGIEFCKAHNIRTCAGSDAHDTWMTAQYATRFDASFSTNNELAAGIRAGHFSPEKLQIFPPSA